MSTHFQRRTVPISSGCGSVSSADHFHTTVEWKLPRSDLTDVQHGFGEWLLTHFRLLLLLKNFR